jgi:hypothetical protein
MRPQMIDGATRVCGKHQGYNGLPIRDEVIDDPVNGPGTPQMVTSWEAFPDEVERIKAGAPVVLSILGSVPPPLLLEVGPAPDERDAATASDLHNIIAGRIVASIVRPVIGKGGDIPQVLTLLESVIVGVILFGVKLGGDGRVLDTMMENVRARLAEQRLTGIEPTGSA